MSAEPHAPPPRANPDLVGHEAAERTLLDAWNSGRMHHAWLIGGPPGVGKATLAFRFARFALAGGGEGGSLFGDAPESLHVGADHPIFARVASGGHADLLTVERAWDEDKGRYKSDISVDAARRVGPFLRLTPAEGGWRVVVIDGAEHMNRSSANAILKVLEEPPRNALLLLVTHNPGALLPTIRSRCRRIALEPLPDFAILERLARYLPDADDEERRILAILSEGSVGRALELAGEGGVDAFRELMDAIGALAGGGDLRRMHAFAEASTKSDATYRVMSALLVWWLARLARLGAKGAAAGDFALPEERSLFERLSRQRGLDRWIELWEKTSRLFAQADAANLDRRQAMLAALSGLRDL